MSMHYTWHGGGCRRLFMIACCMVYVRMVHVQLAHVELVSAMVCVFTCAQGVDHPDGMVVALHWSLCIASTSTLGKGACHHVA